MREIIMVLFMCYSPPYTVKPDYWSYSQLESSEGFLSLLTLAEWWINWINSMHFDTIVSDRNEETKASAVPSEPGFCFSEEWCIMGHVREQRLWWSSRSMVCLRAHQLQDYTFELLQVRVHINSESQNGLEKISASMWSSIICFKLKRSIHRKC